jgi:hypothetical protein
VTESQELVITPVVVAPVDTSCPGLAPTRRLKHTCTKARSENKRHTSPSVDSRHAKRSGTGSAPALTAPEAVQIPGVSLAIDFGSDVGIQHIIDDSDMLGYKLPGEPLTRMMNLETAARRHSTAPSPIALMVIGEGMNSSANHLLDPKCPSGKALLGALEVCLLGTTYAIGDVLVSDLCLGFHPVHGAKPTQENKDFGFLQNISFVDLLLEHGFDVVVLLVGLQAGNKLFTALTTRSRVFVTTTYHSVLVSNDQRDKTTTAAARLTLAAGARLMRLALNLLTGSSTTAPTLNQVMCF